MRLTPHRNGAYGSLKLGVQDGSATSPIANEIRMLKKAGEAAQDHPGSDFVRRAEDIFEVEGPTGSHQCIVTKPQGCTSWTLQNMCPDGKVPVEVVKDFVHRMIAAANFLHLDCGVIHTSKYVVMFETPPLSMAGCGNKCH